ncbi:gliding motility protein [Bacteroidia bacterium]|nr:gliding motility protein [Bacteroidia bacterium]
MCFTSCSTKKNSWINRNYHEVTSYFNIYWNANNTYQELLKQIEEFDYDNYNDILPVFEYGVISDTAQTNIKTNRLLEKSAKIIAKHSMVFRGKEYVNTVKKAFLMNGIGYFYQHDYSSARVFFNYVSSNFSENNIKYDALLWSARSYIEEEEYDMANSLLSQIQIKKESLEKTTLTDYVRVYADYYIKQKKYDEAIPYLKESLTYLKKGDSKSRIYFILAQIEQKEQNFKDAYSLYKTVLKSNPPLKIDFNSRLNIALCYDQNYGNAADVQKDIEKLLKDKKNEKYFGRIYFIIAEMKLRDENITDAMDYLEKSVIYSAADRDQLAQSSIKLADIYFEQNDYENAEKYYKIANSVILENHTDYDKVKNRSSNLSNLVKYLETVKFEELMQFLSSLPEAERNNQIEKLIKEYNKKLAEEKEKEANAPEISSSPGVAQTSSWYFYNEQTKSFGSKEFYQKWGSRENTDLWFLKTKPQMTNYQETSQESEVEQETKKSSGEYTPADKEYYINNIPYTFEEKQASDKRLEENKYLLGINYFDLVEEAKLGATTLEEVLIQYPNTIHKLQIYYYLYRMYLTLDDTKNMTKYKNLLIQEFPDSEQTKQVTDPNYYNNVKANTLNASNLYEYTFESYSLGMYDAVLSNVAEAERRYPGNIYMPKFKFLEAMSSGSNGVHVAISKLENFITTYPEETQLVDIAKSTISYYKTIDNTQLTASESNKPTHEDGIDKNYIEHSMYKYDAGAEHFCVIFIDVPAVNEEILKIRLSDFNRRFYNDDKLNVLSENYNNNQVIIIIKTLKTAIIAMDYATNLSESSYVFNSIAKDHVKTIIISKDNFSIFQNLKNFDAYQLFYNENYIQ